MQFYMMTLGSLVRACRIFDKLAQRLHANCIIDNNDGLIT